MAIFKDRIEIYNPGLFPDKVNPEDFFTGHEKSILLNPLIAETMYKSKDIERWGSSIKRIHDECVAAGVKVEFKRLKTGFVVVFYRPKWEEGEGIETGGQKTREKILRLIKETPEITTSDLSAKAGVTPKGVEWNISKLKKEGLIKRVGPDKGGHWELIK